MGAGDFTPQTVRKAFYDREKERCFVCRTPLRWEDRGIGWSAHHRKPRGMGGVGKRASRLDPEVAEISSISNCLVICGSGVTGCHGRIERNREVSLRIGLLISRNGKGPEFAPSAVRARRLDGTWVWLTTDGRAVEIGEEENG